MFLLLSNSSTIVGAMIIVAITLLCLGMYFIYKKTRKKNEEKTDIDSAFETMDANQANDSDLKSN